MYDRTILTYNYNYINSGSRFVGDAFHSWIRTTTIDEIDNNFVSWVLFLQDYISVLFSVVVEQTCLTLNSNGVFPLNSSKFLYSFSMRYTLLRSQIELITRYHQYVWIVILHSFLLFNCYLTRSYEKCQIHLFQKITKYVFTLGGYTYNVHTKKRMFYV